ncbi:hypothetical protein BGY98DRAFT_988549 [Russula aff. rugulosa BPL654]|nr:hypothetical protein BGY98DRAFT_988549 [Russula aff. rugulosa BPL654]
MAMCLHGLGRYPQPRTTSTLFPMHVLSQTTTNAPFLIQNPLHLLFAFVLDVCALSALVFILFSIFNIQTNRRAVYRVIDGNGALSGRPESVNRITPNRYFDH